MKVRAFLNTEKHSSDDGVLKLSVILDQARQWLFVTVLQHSTENRLI